MRFEMILKIARLLEIARALAAVLLVIQIHSPWAVTIRCSSWYQPEHNFVRHFDGRSMDLFLSGSAFPSDAERC